MSLQCVIWVCHCVLALCDMGAIVSLQCAIWVCYCVLAVYVIWMCHCVLALCVIWVVIVSLQYV